PPLSTLFPYTSLFRSLISFHPRCQSLPLLGRQTYFQRHHLAPPILAWPAVFALDWRSIALYCLDAGLLPHPVSPVQPPDPAEHKDRKSTRLNSSHVSISYAVFCLKKKNNQHTHARHYS